MGHKPKMEIITKVGRNHRVECKPRNVNVIFIHRDMLMPPKNVLSSYHQNFRDAIRIYGACLPPEETLRNLYTLQQIINTDSVSYTSSNLRTADGVFFVRTKKGFEEEQHSAKRVKQDVDVASDLMTDDGEADEDNTNMSNLSLEEEAEEEDESGLFDERTKELVNKVDEYVEPIYDRDMMLIGWRFWFLVLDPSYSIDYCLRDWFLLNKRRRNAKHGSKYAKPVAQGVMNPYSTKKDWISTGIWSYWKEQFKGRNLALHMELDSHGNPANCHKVFSFEQSCVHLQDAGASSKFFSQNSYLLSSGEVCFPNGAYYISPEFRDPDVLFEQNWVDLLQEDKFQSAAYDDFKQDSYLQRIQQRRLADRSEKVAYSLADNGQSMKRCYIETRREKLSKEEFLAFRCSKEVQDLVFSVLASDGEIPANRVIFEWYKRNNPSMYVQSPMRSDPTLSIFGNYIKRDLKMIEFFCQINHLHPELLLLLQGLLGLTDQQLRRFRIHYGLVGIPSSGKSYMVELILKYFVIFGMMIEKSEETERITSAALMENGFSIYYDEMPEKFLLKSDDPRISSSKQLLTRGVVNSRRPVSSKDPNNKKLAVQDTEYQCKSSHIVCYNRFWSSMDKGLQSRFVHLPCPDRVREDGKNYTGLNVKRTGGAVAATINEQQKRYFHEWKMLQFHSAMITLLQGLGLMEDIDVSHAKTVVDLMVKFCAEKGIRVEPRQQEQILLQCMNLTRYYAIKRVFFKASGVTGKEPFDFEAIYKTSPFLVATKEITWFAFTQIASSFVNPILQSFLVHLKDLFTLEPQTGETYYSLTLTSTKGGEQALRKEFSALMYRKIISGRRLMPSEENITDLIIGLEQVSRDYGVHPVLRWRTSKRPYVVEVHKGFVDEFLNKHLLVECIEACFDQFSPFEVEGIYRGKEQKMNIMTAISTRDMPGGKPYEFLTVPWKRDRTRVIRERNPLYIDKELLSDMNLRGVEPQNEYIKPKENVEVVLRRERIARDQLQDDPLFCDMAILQESPADEKQEEVNKPNKVIHNYGFETNYSFTITRTEDLHKKSELANMYFEPLCYSGYQAFAKFDSKGDEESRAFMGENVNPVSLYELFSSQKASRQPRSS